MQEAVATSMVSALHIKAWHAALPDALQCRRASDLGIPRLACSFSQGGVAAPDFRRALMSSGTSFVRQTVAACSSPWRLLLTLS